MTTTRLIDPTMDAGRTHKDVTRRCRIGHCGHPACERRIERALNPTEADLIAALPRFMQAMFPKTTKPLPAQSEEDIDVGGTVKGFLRDRRINGSFRTKRNRRRPGPNARALQGILGDSL